MKPIKSWASVVIFSCDLKLQPFWQSCKLTLQFLLLAEGSLLSSHNDPKTRMNFYIWLLNLRVLKNLLNLTNLAEAKKKVINEHLHLFISHNNKKVLKSRSLGIKETAKLFADDRMSGSLFERTITAFLSNERIMLWPLLDSVRSPSFFLLLISFHIGLESKFDGILQKIVLRTDETFLCPNMTFYVHSCFHRSFLSKFA